jgi:hypothetical protein
VKNRTGKYSWNIENLEFSQRCLWRVISSGLKLRLGRWKSIEDFCPPLLSSWFLPSLALRSWRWLRQVPPKLRCNYNKIHGLIFKKI